MLALTLVAVLTAGDDAVEDAPYERPLESMSRLELRQEYLRLEEVRPGLGGPITMMAVGGGLIAYGGIFLVSVAGPGGPGSLFSNGNALGYIFVAMLMAGGGLLIPGIWLAWNRKDERRVMGERMDSITERLEQLDRASDYARERREPYRPSAPATPPPPGYQL